MISGRAARTLMDVIDADHVLPGKKGGRDARAPASVPPGHPAA
jgi:hypothetical protein